MLADCIDELLRGHLHAEVDHAEPGSFQHDVHKVLAYVVNVTFDRSHHERADGFDPGLGQQRAQYLERAGHGPPGNEHLRHEEVTAFEASAHLLEGGNEGLEQERLGIEPHLEPGVGELEYRRAVSHKSVVVHLFEQLVPVHAAPSFRGW